MIGLRSPRHRRGKDLALVSRSRDIKSTTWRRLWYGETKHDEKQIAAGKKDSLRIERIACEGRGRGG
eukprot:768190-Hanusia_phi.AAC.5